MKNRKFISIIISFILLIGTIAVPSAFATDNDVPDGFTGIYNNEDLNAVRNNLDGKFILMNDIDTASVTNWIPIGSDTAPFTGTFNGNGYSVKNLTVNIKSEDSDTSNGYSVGLFGTVEDAVIANVDMENVNISINYPYEIGYPVGAVAGESSNSKILNCSSNGNIEAVLGGGFDMGGIVGKLYGKGGSLVENCSSSANLKATGKDEGIFDFPMGYSTIVGGIVGSASYNNTVSKCFFEGTINIVPLHSARAGGILGVASSNSSVINCGNIGVIEVNGFGYAGGICSISNSVINSYSTGSVTVTDETYTKIGGIAARAELENGDSISNCYYTDSITTAISNIDDSELESVKSLTNEDALNKASYKGFDFENVWDIVPGKTPVLKSAETNIPDKITVSAGEIYALPFEVTYIASNNEKIAKIESDNAIKGVFEGNTSIEIITASGNFEVVEISVVEEGGFIVSVVKKITALFAAIFESLSEFFFKG